MRKTAKSIALILAVVMIIAMFPLTASAASNKPGKVKITSFSVSKVSKSTNTATVTIKWKKVSKATGYWVYERDADGKWVVIKKLSKKYGGIKIYKESAGQRAFKVRAVRKVKGKTYKGSFSSIKSKFIKSPLSLENLYKLWGWETEGEYALNTGGTLILSVKGDNLTLTGNLPEGSDAGEFFDVWGPLVNGDLNTAKLQGGVKGTTATVELYVGNTYVDSRSYSK